MFGHSSAVAYTAKNSMGRFGDLKMEIYLGKAVGSTLARNPSGQNMLILLRRGRYPILLSFKG